MKCKGGKIVLRSTLEKLSKNKSFSVKKGKKYVR